MLDVIKNYKFWFILSGIILLAGIVSLIAFGLNAGIDFTGGTLSQVRFEKELPQAPAVKSELNSAGFEVTLQSAADKSMIIRTPPQEAEQHDKLLSVLNEKFGSVTEEQFTSIGPVIGKELRQNAAWQLLLVSLGIVLYIAYVFRRVSKPVSSWKFGISAIIALLHDLLIVVGVFSILGYFLNVQVDSLFITALLTVLGFSVHDTIVVFDRIRENLRTMSGYDLGQIINDSVNQTLIRSINTSLTVLFVLLALLLFGGETIKYFVLALLIGIVAGTYSSIFIASPLLYVWHRWDLRRRA
ncbi:MAG: protein translocase subunit SecF [Candidatus Doudnabacteria bacterium]|nr:protein translocase subunit SecF [Candidatus Doudnabacteria bacterium]